MLRDRSAALVLTAFVALAAAGCGGDDEEPADPGVRFAVYDSERQLGDDVDEGRLHCGPPRVLCPPNVLEPSRTYYYEPQGEPELDESAAASASVQGSETEPIVVVEFTTEGMRGFQELTKRLSEAGREAQRQHHAAIVVGTEVVALAAVDYEAYPNGIQTTQLQFFAVDQADGTAIAERINGTE